MVDTKYKMDDLLKRYPLVKRAFETLEGELEEAVFSMGGEKAVTENPKRIIETVLQNVDGTDAEKQALIIATMYASCPAERIEQDMSIIESEYGPETKAIMDELHSYDKKGAAPTNVSRIGAVMSICLLAITAPTFADGVSAKFTKQVKEELAKVEKNFLPNLKAPKLEQLYQMNKLALLAALETSAPSQPENKATVSNQHGGPKPRLA